MPTRLTLKWVQYAYPLAHSVQRNFKIQSFR
jgi:hypothetical protein